MRIRCVSDLNLATCGATDLYPFVAAICQKRLAATRFANPYYDDYRLTHPRFQPDNLVANIALVDFVRRWARRKEVTPAQLSLVWLLAQKPWNRADPRHHEPRASRGRPESH